MSEQAGERQADQGLLDVLLDRLERSALTDGQQLLVLAAFEGDEQLEHAVAGAVDVERRTDRLATEGAGRPHAYLEKVTVRAFRGIGAGASLHLQPGPGLTLVVGRNGSGKSTFAEGIETALTGTSFRWKDKTSEWKGGWRNLHEDDDPSVVLELALDGERGGAIVTRTWTGDKVDESECWLQRRGQPRTSLSALSWESALATYRPFLSYSELGQTVAGKPSEMYDALASILGLEQLTTAERRLDGLRKMLNAEMKEVDKDLPSLLTELAELDDERARAMHAVLSERRKDLQRAAALVAGSGPAVPASERDGLLRWLAMLTHPDRDRVAEAYKALRSAGDAVAGVRESPAEDSRRLAGLLQRALDHYERHTSERSCPVCGTEDVLDSAWAQRTRTHIEQMQRTSEQATAAAAMTRQAVTQARALLTEPPPWLPAESPVRNAWAEYNAGVALDDAHALADHIAQTFPPLRDACVQAREEATEQFQKIEDRWRPVALRLDAWVRRAEKLAGKEELRTDVKAAYDWLRDAGLALRNDRLQPLATRSAEIWQQLRQASNVDLGPISLVGRPGAIRRVALDVTVDGVDGTALGVMSQGELHALSLALFLPRATMPESPFHFLVIDDPVQSMDPAKVDGLARVLCETAADLQVVVFTHDARLPDAIRRLDLPATVWEVVRRENSQVELRKVGDPVTRALDDARALALTATLPDDVATRVIPGFCRSALEARLVELVWRRRLAAGVPHGAIAQDIELARSTYALAALAFFDDQTRTGDVLARVNRYGQWAGDTFKSCKSAGHGPYVGDVGQLVADTRKLVERLDAER